jgi:uncharacterized protein DUF3597
MSIFSSIVNAILHRSGTSTAQAAGTSSASTSAQGSATASSAASSAPSSASTSPASPQSTAAAGAKSLQSVDVDAVLTQLAASKGGGGNWRTSIVDLLKLLDLDSSLSARKELANELNVHAGPDGSAEQNIALHKAVMQKLAENGGKVPDSLRH